MSKRARRVAFAAKKVKSTCAQFNTFLPLLFAARRQTATMTAPALMPLSNQVAGHPDGVQSLEGGRLVVKTCLPRELGFYEEVKQAIAGTSALPSRQVDLLKSLSKAMPECYGSWQQYLPGQQSGSTTENEAPRIVLENLTYGYKKSNVCDIKLGTQLWDDDASEEKRQRMLTAAANTTSGSHGIRLTGWQTYDSETGLFHTVPKAFGKTIGPQHLDLGMRMTLACPLEGDATLAESMLSGVSISDKGKSRLPILPQASVEESLRRYILPDLENLHSIFSELEVRLRGASLLFVYEGDPSRLSEALANGEGRIAEVRVIDFGHASIVPGEGPDEGVLLGISTVIDLARRQLERLQKTRDLDL